VCEKQTEAAGSREIIAGLTVRALAIGKPRITAADTAGTSRGGGTNTAIAGCAGSINVVVRAGTHSAVGVSEVGRAHASSI